MKPALPAVEVKTYIKPDILIYFTCGHFHLWLTDPQDPNKDNRDKDDSIALAKALGFKKTNYYSHGQTVFQKGKKFITRDIDSHNGGFWKMADSVANLARKQTRLGTYDKFLNRIGD
jgi:putative RNase toxin 21 of polymorphic toxin system